jgi:hypothetical protein
MLSESLVESPLVGSSRIRMAGGDQFQGDIEASSLPATQLFIHHITHHQVTLFI